MKGGNGLGARFRLAARRCPRERLRPGGRSFPCIGERGRPCKNKAGKPPLIAAMIGMMHFGKGAKRRRYLLFAGVAPEHQDLKMIHS